MSIDKRSFMGEIYDINDYYKTFPAGSERDTIHEQGKFIKFQWSGSDKRILYK